MLNVGTKEGVGVYEGQPWLGCPAICCHANNAPSQKALEWLATFRRQWNIQLPAR